MKKAKSRPRRRSRKRVNLAEAILMAMEQVGEDGKGKNGISGFLKWAAIMHPRAS